MEAHMGIVSVKLIIASRHTLEGFGSRLGLKTR
jgi:hypothetical protein